MKDKISVKGARVNNLKNIDVDIPKNKLVVITGLSGSGKSSLAFDTLYAEGQRRYAESLSSYAKHFLDLMDKPDVDAIEGLSPTIAIDQKANYVNPRSTVGTVTEIYDYLRLLFSKIGIVHCPDCGREINKQTTPQVIEQILSLPIGTRIQLMAPIIFNQPGSAKDQIEAIDETTFSLLRIDGSFFDVGEAKKIALDEKENHTVEILVDSIVISEEALERKENDIIWRRIRKGVDLALDLGNGFMRVNLPEKKKDIDFSLQYICHDCDLALPDIEPRSFSFNSPFGACPACRGLGTKLVPDPDLIISNKKLTLDEGAIKPWSRNFASQNSNLKLLEAVARKNKFSMSVPVNDLSKKALDIIYYGTGDETYDVAGKIMTFEGVISFLLKKHVETKSEYLQKTLEDYMRVSTCPDCEGKRLNSTSLKVTLNDYSISDVTGLDMSEAIEYFTGLEKKWKERSKEGKISKLVLKEIKKRLELLVEVGLGYLTMSRGANTLAGGEAQRIRLATQIGSGLESIVYILDEPTIGLHSRDTEKLISTLLKLKEKGNSVVVVEHDEAVISVADHLIDIGPGAGKFGGHVISEGTPSAVKKDKTSLTGRYLAGREKINMPKRFRKGNGKTIKILGASEFNLKNINVTIPLGKLVVVSGVSGSGKSTLMTEILAKALANKFYRAKELPGAHKEIKGLENLDKVINIDQSPIGRTPRSNPATYTGVFTYIRDLYASQPESKIRGFKQGHFSFNVKGGGRCETCAGDGMVKIEMQFLPDVYVECEDCYGRRYNDKALEINYKGKNIADILDMSVSEAKIFFESQEQIVDKLAILEEVGLGYLHLGQSATTLSGGEAQRVKLATELSRRPTGKTLYILDEPTTGLHFDDVKRLLAVLHRLADKGNSVLIIEHNMEVIKSADWIIDLGPEGGRDGGEVVAAGTPIDVAKIKKGYTGKYLKKVIE